MVYLIVLGINIWPFVQYLIHLNKCSQVKTLINYYIKIEHLIKDDYSPNTCLRRVPKLQIDAITVENRIFELCKYAFLKEEGTIEVAVKQKYLPKELLLSSGPCPSVRRVLYSHNTCFTTNKLHQWREHLNSSRTILRRSPKIASQLPSWILLSRLLHLNRKWRRHGCFQCSSCIQSSSNINS